MEYLRWEFEKRSFNWEVKSQSKSERGKSATIGMLFSKLLQRAGRVQASQRLTATLQKDRGRLLCPGRYSPTHFRVEANPVLGEQTELLVIKRDLGLKKPWKLSEAAGGQDTP